MKNSTLTQIILAACNHYYDYETFSLDQHSNLLFRMSKTQYGVQIQKALNTLIQAEANNYNLSCYKAINLINSFLMVGGNFDSIPDNLFRELSVSEQMRLNWIRNKLTVSQVCENLLLGGIISHVDQDRISFLDSRIHNLPGELILIDIFSNSLLLFYQDENDEIHQSDGEYFTEVLSKFLQFSCSQSLIRKITAEIKNITAQITLENRSYELRVSRSQSLIEQVYSELNQIFKLNESPYGFLPINLHSDLGFLFGDVNHIVQVLSKWLIPYLSDR